MNGEYLVKVIIYVMDIPHTTKNINIRVQIKDRLGQELAKLEKEH